MLQPENEATINAYLMRSVDNLNITERGHGSLMNGMRLGSGRRFPDLLLDYATYGGAIRGGQRFAFYFLY